MIARKTIIRRSRCEKKNHLSIIIHTEDNEKAEKIIEEMRKAIRKTNCQEKTDISYEIFVTIGKEFKEFVPEDSDGICSGHSGVCTQNKV